MNSQSPMTVGMEPPVMANDHLTFSFGTSAAVRPGLAWKRCEAGSKPTLVQSEPVGLIGGFVAHFTSTPTTAGGAARPPARACGGGVAGVGAAGAGAAWAAVR